MDKHQQMQELISEAQALSPKICGPYSCVVWGEGDLNSPIAIIGEAPGARETMQRKPFVGPAALFLISEMQSLGIERNQIYLSNTVKCRPTQLKSSKPSNRAPTPAEIDFWSATIKRELEVIAPRVVLCLGNQAASALIHRNFKMNEERGKWFETTADYSIIATYHPSYVSRFGRRIEEFRRDLKEAIGVSDINKGPDYKSDPSNI